MSSRICGAGGPWRRRHGGEQLRVARERPPPCARDTSPRFAPSAGRGARSSSSSSPSRSSHPAVTVGHGPLRPRGTRPPASRSVRLLAAAGPGAVIGPVERVHPARIRRSVPKRVRHGRASSSRFGVPRHEPAVANVTTWRQSRRGWPTSHQVHQRRCGRRSARAGRSRPVDALESPDPPPVGALEHRPRRCGASSTCLCEMLPAADPLGPAGEQVDVAREVHARAPAAPPASARRSRRTPPRRRRRSAAGTTPYA